MNTTFYIIKLHRFENLCNFFILINNKNKIFKYMPTMMPLMDKDTVRYIT